MDSKDERYSLLCQLSKADSLWEICDLAYALLGNPIFIQDMAYTILAYTKCINIPHVSWQTKVIQGELDHRNSKQKRESTTNEMASAGSAEPVVVHDNDLPFSRILKVLMENGNSVGVIVLTAYFRSFGPNDVDLVELVSTFIIPKIKGEKYYTLQDFSGKISVVNYFEKLLDGIAFSSDRVSKRLELLSYRYLPNVYVLTISSVDGTVPDKSSLSQILEEFLIVPYCTPLLYNNRIVCIYSSEKILRHWDEEVPALFKILKKRAMIAGVSRCFRDLSQMHAYYDQSLHALEIGRLVKHHKIFLYYDSLSIFQIFRELPPERVNHFYHQKIRELNEYDMLHHTELCTTLRVYLEHARSLSNTAGVLYIHRNTVRYRINKCMDFLGSDLGDGEEIFSFLLSLYILEYEKKFLNLEKINSLEA